VGFGFGDLDRHDRFDRRDRLDRPDRFDGRDRFLGDRDRRDRDRCLLPEGCY
jgi:hypothetical protein